MADQDKDQKTQPASPQRIAKAYEDGQIGFSADLIGGMMLAMGVMYFWFAGEWFFSTIGQTIIDRATIFQPMIADPRMIVDAATKDLMSVAVVMMALVLPLFLIAVTGGVFQTNFNISFKPLNLKWDKMSIPAGVKRIFSIASLVRGALSIAKATVVISIIYLIAESEMENIAASGFASFQMLMISMCRILIYVSISIAMTMAMIGILDLAFQKWKQMQDLRMSLQELKDEFKDSEGDPQMKARMKKLASEISQNQMLNDVPKADVIIRNPTHFAIAIKYDRESMDAPIVLAKGKDLLAQKIIDIAEKNDVAIVERKPVARFLFFNTKIGDSIPFELYQAVAEILNYVNRLKESF